MSDGPKGTEDELAEKGGHLPCEFLPCALGYLVPHAARLSPQIVKRLHIHTEDGEGLH